MLNFGFYNMDCMEGMKHFPDKYFDLAIVDPPYFSGPEKRIFYGKKVSPIGVKRCYRQIDDWEIPTEAYFRELQRVSKHQIIWGCNYFDFPFSSGRIVWDKCNEKTFFSDAEIAFCSMHDSVRLFRYMWNGMCQGKSLAEGHIMQGNKKLNEKRIHPTQKPVVLYDWLLMEYAKPGDKILDTHVGSGSSLIACKKAGMPYVGFEKNEGIYQDAVVRLNEFDNQMSLLW